MRLFRQKKPFGWEETFLRIEEKLRRLAQEPALLYGRYHSPTDPSDPKAVLHCGPR
jgi:hypothetical protein